MFAVYEMVYKRLYMFIFNFSDLCSFRFKHVLVNFCICMYISVVSKGLWKSTLRKHAYSNIQKISPPKTENFPINNSDIFHISAQNIDCWYSLELPH